MGHKVFKALASLGAEGIKTEPGEDIFQHGVQK